MVPWVGGRVWSIEHVFILMGSNFVFVFWLNAFNHDELLIEMMCYVYNRSKGSIKPLSRVGQGIFMKLDRVHDDQK